jgi:photosystem II stability/assembly factor-like uncharacterized protein
VTAIGKKTVLLVVGYLLIVVMAGCGGHGKPVASTSTPAIPQGRQITTTQATTIPSPATQNQAASAQPALDAVDFVSDTVGYIGGQGIILKSSDGGLTWVNLYTSPDNVVSVDSVDAVNVWAATSGYLLRSTDGRSFQRVNPAINAGQGGKGISAIDFVSGDQGFILANGVIWRLTNGVDVQMVTPPGRVDSLSFVDLNNGFAAGANLVYKTSDGGRTWARIFTAPLATNVPSAWQAMICAGSDTNAWLMVYGGDAGAGNVAYVVFHTTDGASFTPVLDEAYMSGDYPTVHLDNSRNLVIRPGTITVHGDQDAFFMGFGVDDLFLIRTVDNGKSFVSFDMGSQGDTLTDTGRPVALSFADATHGWLVGTQNDGQGIILYTTDGGTFKAEP